MATTSTHMTVEEYRAWSREGDGTQLIAGEVVMNQPSLLHEVVRSRLDRALGNWSDAAPGRGLLATSTNVVLGDRDWYGPDLVWWSEAHLPADIRAHVPDPSPDLVVEIRSPSTWRYDVGRKRAQYERHGIAEAWLLDDRSSSVLVHRRSAPGRREYDVALDLGLGDTLTSPLLPEFALDLGTLFRT